MRALGFIGLASLPLVLASSCLLPSFDNVDAPAMVTAGNGGASPEASAGAGGVSGEAGEAGAAGSVPPAPADDAFSTLQGVALTVPAPGVLANDSGSSLTVSAVNDSDATRPAKYDASTLSIAPDGSLEFKPQASFFGSYSLQYTVTDASGATAQATVKITVKPVKAALSTVRDGVGGFVIDGAASDGIGHAVAAAGDVNHDGFDDILIGAAQAGNSGAGRAYVVYGRANPTQVTLSTPTSKSTFCELDGASGDGAGNAVAGIGDINGDKLADFAIAASAGNNGSGTVYIVFGGALNGAIPLGTLAASSGVTLTGASSAPIGALISQGGDVNGDGVPDLLVSGASSNGRVYAVPGSKTLKSAEIDAVPGVLQIEGAFANELLPLSLDYVGHVDSDAKDEIVMASRSSVVMLLGNTAYPANTGVVLADGSADGFYYTLKTQGATPAVAGAGNVDGDAAHSADFTFCETVSSKVVCNVLFGPQVSLSNAWSFSGFSELPRLAHGADIDGDGLSDLLFGDSSQVYAVYGQKSGHSAIDVSALGDAGFTLTTEASDRVDSVVTLGDVNGDGALDYAVGDSSANNGTGSVFVVYGSK